MGTISSIGIGSGLDINSIITQLVAVEQVPLNKLKTEATTLQTKLSTYGKVQSYLSALREASSALTRTDTWGATTGTSSDPSAVGVTTSATTKTGSYALSVQSLAASQSNATGTFANADSLVGEGSLHIELGTWGAGQTSFTPKAGVTAIDITIASPGASLAELRDQINAAGAGVTASVLSDANGARLVLRSTATGASNGFRVGVTDTDGNNTNATGLSALAFDPSAGVTTMAQALAAANASATLNNLPISSESNTLSNVLDGMTLTLNKVTTAPVQLTAAQDNTSMRKALDTFVTAYNDLNKLLADQTKYDAGTKAAGGLQGDSAAVGIRAQMRAMIGSTGGVSTMFKRLSDIGFDVKLDGSISLSDTKINNALANLAETKKLFANTDLLVPTNNGIANQMRALADRLIGVDGTVSTRSEGLRKRIDLNQDRQDLLSDRIAAVEKRLRAQYTALDKTMGQLTGLSSYITQQFTNTNNSNN
ncbi:MAG: flagellar filament capping protein FliD [Burkholderiaceae bacterium]